ncbi:Acetyltransferase (GNAT) family protein [Aspergillus niger]|uniref:Acetyltransferase (GNAT) family protein n=1 Tax=Aspergillus niger TaxID=5061 RepID=A0A505I4R8_ASPNG|nr:Acetyltransferase (GNAT) family protein [Aspergillus niger]
MDVSQKTVEKVQRFAEKRQRAEDFYENQEISPAILQAYNRRLDETLRELQDQVKRQEDDLRRLREVNAFDLSKIGSDTWSRVAQVQRAKRAYDSLLKSETEFPASGSPLPSLLAIEETSRLVKETKVSVSMTAENISSNRQRLKLEEGSLRDAQVIRDGLRKRIQTISSEKTTKEKKTASQLAPLGGPTVGDAAQVSDATLQLGYTSHGKPKKPKNPEAANPDAGQRRIDEILPRQSGQGDNQPANRREAAALEMRNLLDALLEAGSSYIDLPRESAASRFLVRAKVAQFHPRDARRLRLIDFGRSLDD